MKDLERIVPGRSSWRNGQDALPVTLNGEVIYLPRIQLN